MSHTITVTVQMRDIECLEAAAQELGFRWLGTGNHKLYGGETPGVGIMLTDWKYPVVVNADTGVASYDNYGEKWGKQEMLDKLVQRYTCQVAKKAARLQRLRYSETQQADGSVRIVLSPMAG